MIIMSNNIANISLPTYWGDFLCPIVLYIYSDFLFPNLSSMTQHLSHQIVGYVS